MPIEIRELVIRATVDPGEAGAGGCASASSSRAPANTAFRAHAGAGDDVVQSCVREVLRILDDKRER
jgi:hypothetical protein